MSYPFGTPQYPENIVRLKDNSRVLRLLCVVTLMNLEYLLLSDQMSFREIVLAAHRPAYAVFPDVAIRLKKAALVTDIRPNGTVVMNNSIRHIIVCAAELDADDTIELVSPFR